MLLLQQIITDFINFCCYCLQFFVCVEECEASNDPMKERKEMGNKGKSTNISYITNLFIISTTRK